MSDDAIEVEIEGGWESLARAERLAQRAAEAALTSLLPLREKVSPQATDEGLIAINAATGLSAAKSLEVCATPHPTRSAGHLLPQGEKDDDVGAPISPGSITILLTTDAELADLNRRFRGKPYPTNVLSFPAPTNPERHLGDIAVAYETCEREANEQNKALTDHLQHLVAHGVLHLVGYDHETEADALVMEDVERRILAGIGVADPYAWRGEP